MSESIKQHSHCQICGKAIPVSEIHCSEECKKKYLIMMKRRKLMVYAMYGIIGIIIVIILFANRL
jgi:predicted nucleic acid-binding Zn ribbon protein